MTKFLLQGLYTRKEVFKTYKGSDEFPGGDWTTGYHIEGNDLVIFANIDSSGKTGHDFPNAYNTDSGIMEWNGKPKSHSGQNTFQSLFEGKYRPQVFVRWDNSNPKFVYLGSPSILSYRDNFKLNDKRNCISIKFNFLLIGNSDEPGPEGMALEYVEGNRQIVTTNRYERNPKLRQQCLDYFGNSCQICGFNFEKTYGKLGRDFCHIHHIQPLGESLSPRKINPIVDLIPLCANCHYMLHRKSPVLKPDELKKLIKDNAQLR